MTNIKTSKRVPFSAFLLISLIVLFKLFSSNALADSISTSTDGVREVVVVEASGLMDPVLVRMMEEIIEEVDPNKTISLVFQINISGSVVEDESVVALGKAISSSPSPISFWVGPSGAQAKGPIVELALISGDIGIAPGSKIGNIGRSVLSSNSSELYRNLEIDEKTLIMKKRSKKGLPEVHRFY